jgi:cytidylate kinase
MSVEGTLMLIPSPSVVLEASQAIARILAEEGITREELLADLVDERQQYNRKRYPELYR